MTTTTERPSARTARRTRPQPPAPTKPVKTERKLGRVALGVALVGLGTLGTVWYVNSMGESVAVAAITGPVARGEVIEASDLTVVDLPAGPSSLRTIPAADINGLVGQFANVELPAGALLTPDSITPELVPSKGSSIVGIALASYQMPTERLRAGDKVRVVETPVSQGEPPAEDPRAIDAVVISSQVSPTGEQTIVNVEVARGDAAALAARAASGRVALVVDSVEN